MIHHRLLRILFIALPLILLGALRSYAQLDAQLSQYYDVPAFYNPGAIGLEDKLRIRAGSRLQWVGIDNAPTAFLATADMPVKVFGKRFGVGIIAQQESAGLFSNLTIGAQLAYKQKLFGGELTIGARVGYASEQLEGSKIYIPEDDEYHDSNDPALPQEDVSGNALDLGAGLWYQHKWFWAGVSGVHLNQPTISFTAGDNSLDGTRADDPSPGEGGLTSDEGKDYQFEIRRQLYFMAGSNIPIKNTLFEVMPSVMVKTDFNTWRAELTGRVRWKKFLTAGIGYRHDDAVVAYLGAEYKGFIFGYSYDYPITAISKASSGSHEIIAGYSLKLNFNDKNKNKHKSIRIM